MARGNGRFEQQHSAIATMREELARRVADWTHGKRDVTTTVPGLILHRRDAPEPGVCEFHPPGLALIVQGSKQVERGRETFTYDESRFLVTCMELPSMNRVLQASAERPYLTMILHFDMQAARQLVLEYDLKRHDGISVVRGTDTAPTTKEVLSAFTRLLDLLDTPADIPFLAGLIQKEILYRLLTSEEGNSLREAVSTNSQANRIAKAIAWLKENFHRPLRIEELAATVHMGVSTLHHHFQAVTAMSPLQYQKQLRLQEARRLLIMESLDVGSAAMRVGYESTTQFSREYSRLFGLPPRRDMQSQR